MPLSDTSQPDTGRPSSLSRSHAVSAAAAGELYRLMMESVDHIAMFSLDEDGRITTWNKGAEMLFGFHADEALGRDTSLIFTPEDVSEGIPTMEIQKAYDSGSALDERWHIRKDGGRFWADGRMYALHDALGRVHGFLKIIRDGTELRELRQTIQRQEEEIVKLRATLQRVRKQPAVAERSGS